MINILELMVFKAKRTKHKLQVLFRSIGKLKIKMIDGNHDWQHVMGCTGYIDAYTGGMAIVVIQRTSEIWIKGAYSRNPQIPEFQTLLKVPVNYLEIIN
mgnify:CR=1 FL=1|tara:strand:- start:865 stop:1161 length:297 start_codon:yes stop_codon:yes gene_type:complete